MFLDFYTCALHHINYNWPGNTLLIATTIYSRNYMRVCIPPEIQQKNDGKYLCTIMLIF